MRKIIQICAIPCGETPSSFNCPAIFALCNDGTLWVRDMIEGGKFTWVSLPEIPQGDE